MLYVFSEQHQESVVVYGSVQCNHFSPLIKWFWSLYRVYHPPGDIAAGNLRRNTASFHDFCTIRWLTIYQARGANNQAVQSAVSKNLLHVVRVVQSQGQLAYTKEKAGDEINLIPAVAHPAALIAIRRETPHFFMASTIPGALSPVKFTADNKGDQGLDADFRLIPRQDRTACFPSITRSSVAVF
jgi:hypothetical protein